jgi:aminoglycoside 3-N-acetyltransferase
MTRHECAFNIEIMGLPLATTSQAGLVAHLRALGIHEGADLVVHSRLISFGLIEGGVGTVYRALREVVGAKATIAVPTYTLSIAGAQGESRVYDVERTPSEGVGVFSEFVRTMPGAIRSICPIHSHAAVGPKAHILDRPDGSCSFGPGSDFEQFLAEEFSTLYLGCAFEEAATFTFHVEAAFGKMPYREWVILKRVVSRGDVKDKINCRYYRRSSLTVQERLGVVEQVLHHAKVMTTVRCMFGASHFVRLSDYYDRLLAVLRDDPKALLASSPC